MAFLTNLKDKGYILLAYLNSTLIYYWMKKNVHEYGDTGFRLSNQYVKEIPIPRDINDSELKNLVQRAIRGENTIRQIDEIVFKSYGFSPEEIEIIKEVVRA